MIEQLSKKLRTLAMLDAIVEQEWEYRYFSYNSNWSDSEEMGSLRDGSGSEWFYWCSGGLAGFKCLSRSHGLMQNLDYVKEQYIDTHMSFVNEPAFSMDRATCIWFLDKGKWIKYGNTVDSLYDLDTLIGWTASDYVTWVSEYYEREIDIDSVSCIFNGQLNDEIILKINPELDLNTLKGELPDIGVYP